jgi:hypothetical protein
MKNPTTGTIRGRREHLIKQEQTGMHPALQEFKNGILVDIRPGVATAISLQEM